MGDLPIGEALSLWKDKVIWVGFPADMYALLKEYAQRIERMGYDGILYIDTRGRR